MSEEKSEKFIIARGEITQEDLEFIVRFLGKQGLSVATTKMPYSEGEVSQPEAAAPKLPEAETIIQGPYTFAQISTQDHFLVREHFFEFGDEFVPGCSHSEMGRALALLTSPTINQGYSRAQVDPAAFGLWVKDRRELGFGPGPPQTFNTGAMHVGSFLGFMESIDSNGGLKIWGLTVKRKDFLEKLANQLKKQTQPEE